MRLHIVYNKTWGSNLPLLWVNLQRLTIFSSNMPYSFFHHFPSKYQTLCSDYFHKFIIRISLEDLVIIKHSGIFNHELIILTFTIQETLVILVQDFYDPTPSLSLISSLNSPMQDQLIFLLFQVCKFLNVTTWY